MKTGCMKDSIRRFFLSCEEFLSTSPDPSGKRTIFTKRNVLLFLGIWFAFWAVLPFFCVGNLYIDISENIEWGRHLQFGYDKNPYVGPWLTYGFYILTGGWPEFSYILSQFFIAAAAWSIFELAGDMFGKEEGWRRAVPAVLAMLMVPFSTIWSGEFNDDVMDFGFWSLLTLFAFRAMRTQSWKWWLLAGLAAGLSLMTKYLALVLFLALLLPLVLTPEGRRSWRNPAFYGAVLLGLLLSLPNALWLLGNDCVALQYAWERAHAEEASTADRFSRPLGFLWYGIHLILLPLAIYTICFVRRIAAGSEGPGRFAGLFFGAVVLVPYLFLFLFSAVTGGEIGLPWLAPCHVFPFLLMTMFLPPAHGIRREKLFMCLFLLLTFSFLTYHLNGYLYRRGYIRSSTGYESYPGRESAADLTKEWRKKYGTPLKFVAGERTEACNTALFSPDHPEPFFSANPLYSQWIHPGDLKKYGALVVWEGGGAPPPWVSDLPGKLEVQEPKNYPRAVVPWFRKLAGEPKTVKIGWGFLPPER